MELHEKIALKELNIINPLVKDYLSGKPLLHQLFTHQPNLDSFINVIESKKSLLDKIKRIEAL